VSGAQGIWPLVEENNPLQMKHTSQEGIDPIQEFFEESYAVDSSANLSTSPHGGQTFGEGPMGFPARNPLGDASFASAKGMTETEKAFLSEPTVNNDPFFDSKDLSEDVLASDVQLDHNPADGHRAHNEKIRKDGFDKLVGEAPVRDTSIQGHLLSQ
jgi:hypothetical protein